MKTLRPSLTPVLLVITLCALTACETAYPPTTKPDNTIKVVETPKGAVAVPPGCPAWTDNTINPYDGQPLPQFGCANARNLAMMVERPDDLVKGRDFGYSSPVTTVGAQRRYNANQTRGLLDLSAAADMAPAATTSSTAASGINGDTPPAATSAPLGGGGSPAASP